MKNGWSVLLKVLKVFSWIWIVFFSILMFVVQFEDGKFNLPARILLIVIICAIPAVFLIWRFKADKEVRLEKMRLQLERKKEVQAIKSELKEIESNEKADSVKVVKPAKKKKAMVSVIVVVLVAAIGFSIFAYPKMKVKSVAKNKIESVLKSPSTANFGNIQVKELGSSSKKVYVVTGYVDAQNGFGAIVRTNFSVSIAKNSKGYYAYNYTTG